MGFRKTARPQACLSRLRFCRRRFSFCRGEAPATRLAAKLSIPPDLRNAVAGAGGHSTFSRHSAQEDFRLGSALLGWGFEAKVQLNDRFTVNPGPNPGSTFSHGPGTHPGTGRSPASQPSGSVFRGGIALFRNQPWGYGGKQAVEGPEKSP